MSYIHLLSLNYWRSAYLLSKVAMVRSNKNSLMGSAWGLVQPFLHIVTIAYFVGFLLRQPLEAMIKNLVASLPLWNLLVSCLSAGSVALLNNEHSIKKALIPKSIFPIADVLFHLQIFGYAFFGMYLALIIIYPSAFSWLIILVPIVMIPFVITITTTAVSLAFLSPYVRDIPQMVGVLLGVLYWTVPIIYPYEMIPEAKRILFEFHPLFLIIRPAQILIVNHQIPSLFMMLQAVGVMLLSSAVCYIIHKKYSRNVIYYL